MLFLDIETQNNWTNGDSFRVDELRISYVGVIDQETDREYDFWEDDMEKLGEMLKATDRVVHYNGFSFDMPVIANYLGQDILNVPQLDLMVAVSRKIGFRPKLDDLANATLGYGKSGKGSDAVIYWEKGELDKLRDYCIQDVRVTMEVYEYGEKNGIVKYFDKNGFMKDVDVDWTLGENEEAKEDEGVISMF